MKPCLIYSSLNSLRRIKSCFKILSFSKVFYKFRQKTEPGKAPFFIFFILLFSYLFCCKFCLLWCSCNDCLIVPSIIGILFGIGSVSLKLLCDIKLFLTNGQSQSAAVCMLNQGYIIFSVFSISMYHTYFCSVFCIGDGFFWRRCFFING